MPEELASEKVVIQSPMSFVGSTRRIWKLTKLGPWWLHIPMTVLAVVLVVIAWMVVLLWTLLFSILLIPYRLLRRGARKRKREELQHRELLNAINTQHPTTPPS